MLAATLAPTHTSAAGKNAAKESVIETGIIPTKEEISPILYRPVEKNLADLGPNTRNIRVLVQYSRSVFFVANGRPQGWEYEAFAEYEKYLNKKQSKHKPRIGITFIPVKFGDLIPYLLEGKGDIAAGQLTITKDRQHQVAFASPYISDVQEVLVAYVGASTPLSLNELSGKTVHVLSRSSYVPHLNDLNEKLSETGLPQIKIVEMPANISCSDILEMVNAGILEYTFVDDYLAELWSKVLPGIKVLSDICLNKGGDIAWAVRPDNPVLLASLNGFVDYGFKHLKEKGDRIWKSYFKNTKFIKNPLEMEAYGRVKTLSPHFKDAGAMNKLDWLMMMAMGYQESELQQNVRSPSGAIGVMQVHPKTAKSMGYNNISTARNNIMAGVAYINYIRQNHFTDQAIPSDARVDFALAAYNAGPARIQSLRQEAKRKGLNPNIWFNNVERVALDRIGEETFRYVSNINKYYVAYRMSHQLDADKADLLISGAPNRLK